MLRKLPSIEETNGRKQESIIFSINLSNIARISWTRSFLWEYSIVCLLSMAPSLLDTECLAFLFSVQALNNTSRKLVLMPVWWPVIISAILLFWLILQRPSESLWFHINKSNISQATQLLSMKWRRFYLILIKENLYALRLLEKMLFRKKIISIILTSEKQFKLKII